MSKIIPIISISIKETPVPQEESDRVLFAFFDSILNEQDHKTSVEMQKVEENVKAVTTDKKEL